MPHKKKLGTPRGVGRWKTLESAGDVKRFLAWCIHSVREQSLDPKTAAIMGQLGSSLLRAAEGHDIEKRLDEMERKYAVLQQEP